MLKFDVDTSGVVTAFKKILANCTKAENEVAQAVKKDTEPFLPYREGELTDRTTVKKNLVIYPGPYARFLYYGKLMVDPETGSAWARKGVKKVLTDKNLVFSKAVHQQAQSHWFEASKAQNEEKWEKLAREVITRGK